MKKLLLALLVITLFGTFSAMAQSLQEKAKALVKPADCGVVDYDAFKNSSFLLKEEVLKTDKNYATVSNDITRYAKGERKLTVTSVKSDIKKVKSVSTSIKSLNDKANKLAESGKNLAANASKVSPASKIETIASNTKNSVKAVDLSREILKGLSTKANNDMGTLNTLLKKAVRR